MLPQRAATGKRTRVQHSQGGASMRNGILLALGVFFLLGFYFNYSFMAASTGDANAIGTTTGEADADALGNILEGAATNAHPKGTATASSTAAAVSATATKQAGKLKTPDATYSSREVQQILFTSGCSELDFVHGEVLASTARATGYERNITHLMYGCKDADFKSIVERKNPAHGVASYAFPSIQEPIYEFGEYIVTTSVNPRVIHAWFTQHGRAHLGDAQFVMMVDSNAIFTKKVDIWNLFREVEDQENPTWFGQDAVWYRPRQFPLNTKQVEQIVPEGSKVLQVSDWRRYAAIAPYVLEASVLATTLPSVVEFWDALPNEKKYLAFPLAAAHLSIPIGILGTLSVRHYSSRYENWDFVDDSKYNPCSNDEIKDPSTIELASYPITMRAINFTLPNWIDGHEWNFFDNKIPNDFLHCDAWLLKEPSPHLWYLAAHTSGYERVPTILRRRHSMSVCLALQAYNRVAVEYRTKFCPFGFNGNKKIPMEINAPVWGSALALGVNTAMEERPIVNYGEFKLKKSAEEAAKAPKPGQLGSNDIHFVFSSTCQPYQNWQTDVLASSFARSGQQGRLTRVVSACSKEELADMLDRSRAHPFLQIHVTEDFSREPIPDMPNTDDFYVPYNKPFGIRDWLRNSNPPVKESVVVIIDPDFVFLQPFVVNSDHRVTSASNVDSKNVADDMEVIEGKRQYKRFFVYEGSRDVKTLNDHVVQGVAVAQRWTAYLGSAGFGDPKSSNFVICPECQHVTKEDAREYYAVGPPYALTRDDLDLMIDDYCNMTVGKRLAHRDDWMSEMVGYSLGASKHHLKHTMFDNLVLSGNGDEYWGFTDLIKENPCEDPDVPLVNELIPPMMHGCHTFKGKDDSGTEWMYYKQFMPEDLFACDSWMLAVPPPSVWTEAKKSGDKTAVQHAYGLCTWVKIVNRAILDHKQKMCPNGFNQNRKFRPVDPRPSNRLKIGQVHDAWEIAANQASPSNAD